MSFITQPRNLLPAVVVGGDITESLKGKEGEEFPWQLRWKRPLWHRFVTSATTTTTASNPLDDSLKRESVTTTNKESGNSLPQKYLIGHASARITESEYMQNHHQYDGDNIHQEEHYDKNGTEHSLLLNVSIFKSGKKPDHTTSSSCHPQDLRSSVRPADIIMIDIIRQQAPDMTNDNDDDDETTTPSSYEYVHQQTLYWPNTNRNLRNTKPNNIRNTNHDDDVVENDSNNKLALTTSRALDGPCSLLLHNNPFLQLLHHILHPFMSPQPPSVFVPSPPTHPITVPPPPADDPSSSTTMRTNHHRNTKVGVSNEDGTGLIAVTFIRIPHRRRHHRQHITAATQREDKSSSSSSTMDDNAMTISTADAMDVLNLLSLQTSFGGTADLSPTDTVSFSERRSDTITTTPHGTTTMNSETNSATVHQGGEEDVPTDLLLACLTNDGKVHLYSPWKLLLLHGSTNSDRKNSGNGFSSFWFGGGTNTLQNNNVLPLRECVASIELSIPYLNRGQQHNESTSLSNMKKQPPPSLISMFDTSMWDATLDPTTLHHQTINNIPTHCVSAHDEYICIVGRGHKRWQYDVQSHADDNVRNDDDSTFSGNAVWNNDGNSFGGFVTFITTNTMSEKRTLFLPFVPAHISPFCWGVMKLLLITGQGRVVAIRLDGGSAIVPAIPVSSQRGISDKSILESPKKQSTVTIHRFQILPIDLSNVGNIINCPKIVGCDALTSPPAIIIIFDNELVPSKEGVYAVQQSLVSFETKKRPQNFISEYQHRPDTATTVVITTNKDDAPTAWIPLVHAAHQKIWCQLGQGWSIVGAGRQSYFVCYEGASKETGPMIKELPHLDDVEDVFVIPATVLPSYSFANFHQHRFEQQDKGHTIFMQNRTSTLSILDNSNDTRPASFKDVEVVDDIIVEAIESISTLTHRENFGSNSPTSVTRRNRQLSLTTQEKSERLLRHCSSWTKLDQSIRSVSMFRPQSPSITLRTHGNTLYILTFRRVMIEHGPAAPFQQVLAWLSIQNDYFTAASIALKLLQDVESLRHLWLTLNKLDNDESCSYLDGLLDGILPIDTGNYDATTTRLADMTVACLTRGGYSMSSTLEQFLSRNMVYDPSRASLMLVASATGALSDDEAHVASVMGAGYSHSSNPLGSSLWPVRCFLKIGVARNRLGTVLMLLNTAIPDELRRRTRFGSRAMTQASLQLCKSLITLIVETSPDSTEILLDLVDERTRLRFWESLDHETRLELSVTTMSGSYPLLRDQEIRSWILAELQKCIESEDLASAANIYDKTPTVWLRALASSCLQNAGCNMQLILHPTIDESKDNVADKCGFYSFSEAIQKARLAARPAIGSGGLDFDIMIPALLVLDHRNEGWHNEAETNTRTVLNAVCYQAGRSELDEPLFVMNCAVLMRQCFRLGDVEAGANLIGGKSGFILHICHALNEELGWSIEDAERFALGESLTVQDQGSTMPMETFSIRDCHRRLLLLLDEHVLKIRTYGEFTESRGKVDPVFAATLFFRTWWVITRHVLTEATLWLTDWLRQQLSLSIVESTVISPHRLTCAALVQALIWPQENGKDKSEVTIDTTPLANKLEMDGIFLLQMAQSCCGMVEALPPNVFESSENNGTNVVMMLKSSLSPNSKHIVSTNDTSIHNRSEYDIDDSFVSAVGTYRDMDISHTTWNT